MCAHYMSVSADDGKCKAISPEVVVSVITPIHNAREFVEDVCKSVASQTFSGGMEWSIYDDASTVMITKQLPLHSRNKQAMHD
eukprot:m.129037 g.129037  ORF g.129037 m.129037 type:complete len:83 (+) comp37960_c0_seq26:62-310(+)